MDRLAQRRATNDLVSSRLAMPRIEISEDVFHEGEIVYRLVRLKGQFDPDQEIILRNRSMEGMPGAHLVTPLLLEGASVAVFVDRGGIPIESSSPGVPTQFRLDGPVEMDGMALPPVPEPGVAWLADPTPNPQEGRPDAWRVLNLERIQHQLPYPILPFYVEQSSPSGVPGQPRPDASLDLSKGPYLGYALQWFAFRAIAVDGGVAEAEAAAAIDAETGANR